MTLSQDRLRRREATRGQPCPVCEATRGCSVGADGLIFCRKRTGPQPGYLYLGQAKGDNQWAQYRVEDDARRRNANSTAAPARKPTDWTARAKRCASALTADRRAELARHLGLPVEALHALPLIGWHDSDRAGPCWTFPEMDGRGNVIGIGRRYADGCKRAMAGSQRGLTVPAGWTARPGPVCIVEGASDVLALSCAGLAAIGRPSNTGGGSMLADLLRDLPAGRDVIVMGEKDAKPDGAWPGLDGCRRVAGELSRLLSRPVPWALPPDTAKDARCWFATQAPADAAAWVAAGQRFLDGLQPQTADRESHDATPFPSTAPPTGEPSWPDPPGYEAYYGLAGEIVRTIEPHTEADPVALLVQTLVSVGSVVGRTAHFRAEADTHYLNEYAVLIGRTAKGRKGTSLGHVRRQMATVDPEWASDRVASGLSSAEGLIWAVRDAITARHPIKHKGRVTGYEDIESDPGVTDKRLLVIESEYASVLRQCERSGNTLSAVMRQAWDGQDLRTLTKNSPARSTAPHISVVGHVTGDELRRYLSTTEMANGFGNRHLWVCVQRSKTLPEGGSLPDGALDVYAERLRQAVQHARSLAGVPLQRDDKARELWAAAYGDLSEGQPGMTGAMLARAEPHVMRLACLYAVLDLAPLIRAPHLLAALALWDYCERSTRYVWGDALGDPLADDIIQMLRVQREQGLARSEIRDAFGRNQSSDRIGRALGLLLTHRLARMQTVDTGGRPAERWYAAR